MKLFVLVAELSVLPLGVSFATVGIAQQHQLLIHLFDYLGEESVDEWRALCRALHVGNGPLARQIAALGAADLALRLRHVTLVGGQDNGNARVALDAQYLLAYELDVLEALTTSETVDDEKALAVLYVQITH